MSDVRINIASEFTGRKAFQQAESATNSLEKSVGKLAKRLAGAFSVYKIAQFSRQSVNAFMEDQKAAASLANELKNVGLSYNTKAVEDFIKTMQQQTGILDDELRPAFGRLIRVTGSLASTQKIMATAFDVSAANGQDYQSVVNALSQAYVGNIKGLKALNLGLTQAEIKSKSFGEILDIINKKFAGAGAAALDTYAGKVKLLKVAFADAQETIGKGFVDAFSTLAGDKDFNSVIDDINNAATGIADIVRGIGVAMNAIEQKTPQWLKTLITLPANTGFIGLFRELGKKQRLADPLSSANTSYFSRLAAQKQQAKADIEAAKRAKALADAVKKQTAAQNELIKKKKEAAALDALSLKYKQAEQIFDMEKIQLAAASMGKQTDEDYARIKLKKDLIDLQNAIQAGDLKTAESLSKIVEDDYKRVWAYQAQNIALGIQNGTIQNIQNAAKLIPTNLNLINLSNLQTALDLIAKMLADLAKVPTTSGTKTTTTTTTTTIPGAGTKDYGGNVIGSAVPNSVADMFNSLFAANGSPITGTVINPSVLGNLSAIGGIPTMSPNAYGPTPVTITVVDNTSGLIDVVTNATQQATANGINTRIVRNTGGLNW